MSNEIMLNEYCPSCKINRLWLYADGKKYCKICDEEKIKHLNRVIQAEELEKKVVEPQRTKSLDTQYE